MGFKKYISLLKSYEAGKPIELLIRDYGIREKDIIKLASNENPLGASKKAIKAIKKEAKNSYRYPDDSMFDLKKSLARKYNVDSKNIIIGQGSDQIIELLVKATANKGDKVLTSSLTFAMYEIYATHNQAEIIKTKDGIHNADQFILEYKKSKPNLVFLCLPNNPLGDCLDKNDVYRILDSISSDTIVALDCAYGEFAAYKDKNKEIKPKDIVKKYKNCIYLGTFSKLYGLGGLRIGYGIADLDFINNLSKLRAPFNVTNISLKAAIAALEDSTFIKNTLKNNFKEMNVYEEFAKSRDIKFIESYTNFITFMLPRKVDSSDLCEYLLKQGVIIRDLKSYGINAVRITIGTKSQNKITIKLIDKYLKR